jgi:hypothetical protein
MYRLEGDNRGGGLSTGKKATKREEKEKKEEFLLEIEQVGVRRWKVRTKVGRG